MSAVHTTKVDFGSKPTPSGGIAYGQVCGRRHNNVQRLQEEERAVTRVVEPESDQATKHARSVIVDNVMFPSCSAAEREFNFPVRSLSRALRIGQKSYCGHSICYAQIWSC